MTNLETLKQYNNRLRRILNFCETYELSLDTKQLLQAFSDNLTDDLKQLNTPKSRHELSKHLSEFITATHLLKDSPHGFMRDRYETQQMIIDAVIQSSRQFPILFAELNKCNETALQCANTIKDSLAQDILSVDARHFFNYIADVASKLKLLPSYLDQQGIEHDSMLVAKLSYWSSMLTSQQTNYQQALQQKCEISKQFLEIKQQALASINYSSDESKQGFSHYQDLVDASYSQYKKTIKTETRKISKPKFDQAFNTYKDYIASCRKAAEVELYFFKTTRAIDLQVNKLINRETLLPPITDQFMQSYEQLSTIRDTIKRHINQVQLTQHPLNQALKTQLKYMWKIASMALEKLQQLIFTLHPRQTANILSEVSDQLNRINNCLNRQGNILHSILSNPPAPITAKSVKTLFTNPCAVNWYSIKQLQATIFQYLSSFPPQGINNTDTPTRSAVLR